MDLSARPSCSCDRSPCDGRGAFTLVELLVAVGVIAVLIGLTLPSLMGGREQAAGVSVLSNLRSAGTSFQQYAAAHDSRNPWAPVGAKLPVLPEGSSISTNDPFALQYAWPTLFHRVAPWEEHYSTWVSGPTRRGPPWMPEGSGIRWPAFDYARAFQGRPELWGAGAQGPSVAPEDWFRPTRADDVQFASSKVLLFDADMEYLRRPVEPDEPHPVLLFDGSAMMRRESEATAPVQNALTSHNPERYHDTPEGVRGLDF